MESRMILGLTLLALASAASIQDTRVKRLAGSGYVGWTAWSSCSTSCGAGTQSRSRGAEVDRKQCTKGPCVVWAAWSNWTPCSETCGEGNRRRNRACPNYFGCASTPTKIAQEANEQELCFVAPCADWTQWGGWGVCSAYCGGGQQSRTRQCSNYGQCQGDVAQNQTCNTHSCCTDWSEWGQCSLTCANDPTDGTEARTRRCVVTIPGTTNQYASEEKREDRPCAPLPPCAEWTEWGSWSSCSAGCGGGERTRERSCPVVGACTGGSATESAYCDNGPCAEFRSWARWTICSASCGGGSRSRQRICSQADGCTGDLVEEEPCGTAPCPAYSEWGPWGYCSEECGSGWQVRTRVCNQYNLCAGDSKEKRLCNTHQCPGASTWGDWGQCSVPCGGGFVIRTRTCDTDPAFCALDENRDSASCACDASMDDSQACNPHRCAEVGPWEAWSSCTEECGGGTHSRDRNCMNDETFCVGINRNHPSCLCNEELSEEESCNTALCPEWSSWQEWGECSLKCGGGANERKRICLRDEDFCADKPEGHTACTCPGLDHSNKQCNAHLCPSWSRWSRWGDCDADCAGGVKSRTRNCRRDEAVCAGPDADDESCVCGPEEDGIVEEPCNEHNCAAWVKWNHWGACSSPCNGGLQTRKRTCYKDFTYCYGARIDSDPSCKCEGTPDGEQVCNDVACPNYGEWSEYSECSASCEGGKMSRVRDCMVDEVFCEDNLDHPACACEAESGVAEEDLADCNQFTCAVWASWTPWADCSQVCGGGSRTRARECPTVGGCPGLGDETQFCNQLPCPDWGEWAPWSDCSSTCGGGQHARTRTCPLKGGCGSGEKLELGTCNDIPCPMWTRWMDWGECTVSCGEGVRIRTRDCPTGTGVGCPGKAADEEICLLQTCQRNQQWSGWSPCTQTCGGGVQVRSRLASLAGPLLEETQECSENMCPEWAFWGSWSSCTASCGSGSRTRGRACEDEFGVEIPRGCIGSAQSIDADPCNDFPC